MGRHKTRNVRRNQWRRFQRQLRSLGQRSYKIELPQYLRGVYGEEYWQRRGRRVPGWWKHALKEMI